MWNKMQVFQVNKTWLEGEVGLYSKVWRALGTVKSLGNYKRQNHIFIFVWPSGIYVTLQTEGDNALL